MLRLSFLIVSSIVSQSILAHSSTTIEQIVAPEIKSGRGRRKRSTIATDQEENNSTIATDANDTSILETLEVPEKTIRENDVESFSDVEVPEIVAPEIKSGRGRRKRAVPQKKRGGKGKQSKGTRLSSSTAAIDESFSDAEVPENTIRENNDESFSDAEVPAAKRCDKGIQYMCTTSSSSSAEIEQRLRDREQEAAEKAAKENESLVTASYNKVVLYYSVTKYSC